MKQFQKWQGKLAEAKDGRELLETLDEMNKAHTDMCFYKKIKCVKHEGCADCDECKAKWLDMEEEE